MLIGIHDVTYYARLVENEVHFFLSMKWIRFPTKNEEKKIVKMKK